MRELDTSISELAGSLAHDTGLTVKEYLLVIQLLLDSILETEINDESDWQNLSLDTLVKDWDNMEDAIYDDWKSIFYRQLPTSNMQEGIDSGAIS